MKLEKDADKILQHQHIYGDIMIKLNMMKTYGYGLFFLLQTVWMLILGKLVFHAA